MFLPTAISFPFEPNSNWSKFHTGDAATKYIVSGVDKHGLKDPDCVQYKAGHIHLESKTRQVGVRAQTHRSSNEMPRSSMMKRTFLSIDGNYQTLSVRTSLLARVLTPGWDTTCN